MGCGQVKGASVGYELKLTRTPTGSTVTGSETSARTTSLYSVASIVSEQAEAKAMERLLRMRELDKSIKVPFLLIELRGADHKDGSIAICGKDEHGVYSALDKFLCGSWQCKKLEVGSLSEDSSLPFCEAMYAWENFLMEPSTAENGVGTNNMALSTMKLVEFMCRELSWTLAFINGGNLGEKGEMREQQIMFRAPHPMNIVSPHMMIKLRSVGFIEVCGGDHQALGVLHKYFTSELAASPLAGRELFCDFCYKCAKFHKGKAGENNLGLLTTQVCDAVVSLIPGWSLVTMNGGNMGIDGTDREQRLVFRWDNHPLRENPHLLVELREAGFVQISGQDVDGIYDRLQTHLEKQWNCKSVQSVNSKTPSTRKHYFCDRMYSWAPRDMLESTAQLTSFFHELGWQMQVSSQGICSVSDKVVREQQILFRPHQAGGEGIVEPHIFIELYTGEGDDELYAQPMVTQLLGNQRIRIASIGECAQARQALHDFVCKYFGAIAADTGEVVVQTYACELFFSRGLTDCNLAMITQRLRDFMVDRLGWRFILCNVTNLGPAGVFREQQLVFRYDGERKEIPQVKEDNQMFDWTAFAGLKFPEYWQTQQVLNLKQRVAILSCDNSEIGDLQNIFDSTFKRILTRDRLYDPLGEGQEMPYRLEIVHAFRSEHAELYRLFMKRRARYSGGDQITVKTQAVGAVLNSRLADGEAYLFHGTNPSSAMGILKNGFVLDHAGKSTGTMLGYGMYLAECTSKSDEYARDDGGGTYPGLMGVLMCRCLVGKPYVVDEAGDHVAAARTGGYDCVVGDRERKVGTYREFVLFDQHQILPEFAVIYRRQYDKTQVPAAMVQEVRGTTGKNWQVKQPDRAWHNLPPNLTQDLNKAYNDGVESLLRACGGESLKFNMRKLEMGQVGSDVVFRIRPPMRR